MPTWEVRAIQRAIEIGHSTDANPDASRAIVDALSVALAGASSPRSRAMQKALDCTLGPQRSGRATVWFTGQTVAASHAALLNGLSIHVDDFDDTHDAAIVHAMSAVLPAALVGAELAEGSKGKGVSVVGAIAAGTELACNLALARGKYQGWHYTTLCGTLGASLAVALAAGVSTEMAHETVGNAYVFAAGNKQAVLDSSPMKRLMPGFAAQNGVLALQSALAGFGHVASWLTGEYGLRNLFYTGSGGLRQVEGGRQARIAELSFKPYPACRFTHGAIEAAVRLREAGEAAAHESVTVRYPTSDRFGIVCRPFRRRGATEMDAQFSTAFLVSAALREGPVTFDTYRPELIESIDMEQRASAVSISRTLPTDDETALGPIEVQVGERIERVEHVLGSRRRPMRSEDQIAKLNACARRATELSGRSVDPAQMWQDITEAASASCMGDDARLLELVRRPSVGSKPTE